jgi:hypothetical protein
LSAKVSIYFQTTKLNLHFSFIFLDDSYIKRVF